MNGPARNTASLLVVVVVGVGVEDRAQPRLPKPCGRVDQKFRFRLISPPPPPLLLTLTLSWLGLCVAILASEPVLCRPEQFLWRSRVRNVVIQINLS